LKRLGPSPLSLKAVPAELAGEITRSLGIPTIGIGAGAQCDGQVLVTNDMLGTFDKFKPKFVKKYANLSPIITDAVKRYADDVRSGLFPGREHSF